jgi:hypothetical protein
MWTTHDLSEWSDEPQLDGKLEIKRVEAIFTELGRTFCRLHLARFSFLLPNHIREHDQRLEHLRELLRVSRRWALFTYFDAASVENKPHEFGRRFHQKRAKWTLTYDEVRATGHAEGFELIQSAWISRFFSGHRYVLMRRG